MGPSTPFHSYDAHIRKVLYLIDKYSYYQALENQDETQDEEAIST